MKESPVKSLCIVQAVWCAGFVAGVLILALEVQPERYGARMDLGTGLIWLYATLVWARAIAVMLIEQRVSRLWSIQAIVGIIGLPLWCWAVGSLSVPWDVGAFGYGMAFAGGILGAVMQGAAIIMDSSANEGSFRHLHSR